MVSYKDILNAMQVAYCDECGELPDMKGDLGIRFKAIASVLFDIGVRCDFAMKQSSWKTATGTYLDDIGEACGIVRQAPAKATGELVFYLDAVKTTSVTIPKGTICSKADNPYVQYETTEAKTIAAGNLSCRVKARALKVGLTHNAVVGEITTIINPPASVSLVENDDDFVGGYNEELDEDYRNRIKAYLSTPHNGLNETYIKSKIKEIADVCGAGLVNERGAFYVYLKTKSGTLSTATKNSIKDILAFMTLLNRAVTPILATSKLIDITILVNDDVDATNEDIISFVKHLIFSMDVGENIDEDRFENQMREKFNSPVKLEKYTRLNVSDKEYLKAGEIKIVRV